jgi:hypothetical protein
MRLIGGRDYYDGALAMGRDESLTFVRSGDRRMSHNEVAERLGIVRKQTTMKMGSSARPSKVAWITHRHRGYNLFTIDVDGGSIGAYEVHVLLAGVLRSGIVMAPYSARNPAGMDAPVWIWSVEALRSYAKARGFVLEEGSSGTVKEWITRPGTNTRVYADVPTLGAIDWFEPVKLSGDVLDKVIAERITVMSLNPLSEIEKDAGGIERPWLIDQATLGAMDFAKAVDPYGAFQEISMWKGGVIPADGNPVVTIVDDKVKIAKHGFDAGSFRKPKAAS